MVRRRYHRLDRHYITIGVSRLPLDQLVLTVTTIEKNIEDREWFDLMVAERGDRFWELCRQRLFPIVVDEVEAAEDKERMNRDEAEKFGKTSMGYGQYNGMFMQNIPLDYLNWLAGESTGWMKQLNRYLRFRNE